MTKQSLAGAIRTASCAGCSCGTEVGYIGDGAANYLTVSLTGTSFSTVYTSSIPITVKAGANTITFHNDTAYAPDLDLITVQVGQSPGMPQPRTLAVGPGLRSPACASATGSPGSTPSSGARRTGEC
ncbi:MAG TPA: hypothetical protein VK599_14125 [Streptosporangiaceae bacterium]|nr:hypothetical protein [Streptosporangiaceae bacterium]